jgi:tRNA pseudouridine32 synthase/23S rRNA pseudouridine746 synthase
VLEGDAGGKMFGVLVVSDAQGRVGFLRGFSGQLDGRWEVEGYVPPLFAQADCDRIFRTGEPRVKGLWQLHEALAESPALAELRATTAAMHERHSRDSGAMRERHQSQRALRRARRDIEASADVLHALDQESRADKAERRRLEQEQEAQLRSPAAELTRAERRLKALARLRQQTSRALMRQFHDAYLIQSAAGERRSLRELFAPGEPPSGAGDCAAPKLLGYAYANHLQPIALAEFWWGRPPISGGRVTGAFYPACREKCAPLLPFMLQGLSVEPLRTFVNPTPVATGLSIVFQDQWIVVIDKPAGLLSVPGKDDLTDSVLTRLKTQFPDATGPLLVHRLDLDTSGLLVAALDSESHSALRKQFEQRDVSKRYIAWVDGEVSGERGDIELPLRVDLDDRPRQILDPVHGKQALTHWEVLEREKGRTRVALFPRTGRTHQLRVHAAHPRGLAAPIVGDRLYGHAGDRLLLHAEQLEFTHPGTGARVTFTSPAPF